MRLIVFPTLALVQIHIDIISIGENQANEAKLHAFVDAVNKDGSQRWGENWVPAPPPPPALNPNFCFPCALATLLVVSSVRSLPLPAVHCAAADAVLLTRCC